MLRTVKRTSYPTKVKHVMPPISLTTSGSHRLPTKPSWPSSEVARKATFCTQQKERENERENEESARGRRGRALLFFRFNGLARIKFVSITINLLWLKSTSLGFLALT